MFVSLAPRLATSFAITVGTVAGGVLALMYTPPPAALAPEAPPFKAAQGPADERVVARAARPDIEKRVVAPAAVVPPVASSAPDANPTPDASSEPSKDLTPSPHDAPLL